MDSKVKNYHQNYTGWLRWRKKSQRGGGRERGRAYGSRNEKWIKLNTVLEDGPHCSAFIGMSRNTITCLMREPMQFSAYTQITAENMRYSGGLLGFICIPAVLHENGVLCCWVRVWFSPILQSQGPICLVVDLTGCADILSQITNRNQCIMFRPKWCKHKCKWSKGTDKKWIGKFTYSLLHNFITEMHLTGVFPPRRQERQCVLKNN